MKLLSSKSASKAKIISSSCTDPARAYERMLSSLKAIEIYIGKTVARNMYNKMIKFRIGTNEVISTAKE